MASRGWTPAGPVHTTVDREFISSKELRRLLRQRVYAEIDPAGMLEELEFNPTKVREDLVVLVDRIVAEEGYLLADGMRREMQAYILDEMLGLGPIDPLLKDPTIEEVMVNKVDEVWVARRIHGAVQLERTDVTFDDEEHVLHIIDRILGPIGRRIDEATPLVNARLQDGSRVNIIIPPLALDGPTITIRKFPEEFLTMEDLIHRFYSLTPQMAQFLQVCVQGRLNIIVSGGTGSGKTTLLNALSGYIDDGERMLTVEDTAELQLHKYKPHVVRLESRMANVEGKGAVTIRDLVVNALRMRPDRIIVGECRSEETVDMLQAMNTGHDGSLTTVHANSPNEAIFRLENMFLMSGLEVPVIAIRQQIAMAIQLVVQVRRLPDGSRRVTRITELVGMDSGRVKSQDLYRYRDGSFEYTGARLQATPRLRAVLKALPPLPVFEDGHSSRDES